MCVCVCICMSLQLSACHYIITYITRLFVVHGRLDFFLCVCQETEIFKAMCHRVELVSYFKSFSLKVANTVNPDIFIQMLLIFKSKELCFSLSYWPS